MGTSQVAEIAVGGYKGADISGEQSQAGTQSPQTADRSRPILEYVSRLESHVDSLGQSIQRLINDIEPTLATDKTEPQVAVASSDIYSSSPLGKVFERVIKDIRLLIEQVDYARSKVEL